MGAAPANLIPRKLMGIDPLNQVLRKSGSNPALMLKVCRDKSIQQYRHVYVKFTNDPGNICIKINIPAYNSSRLSPILQ